MRPHDHHRIDIGPRPRIGVGRQGRTAVGNAILIEVVKCDRNDNQQRHTQSRMAEAKPDQIEKQRSSAASTTAATASMPAATAATSTTVISLATASASGGVSCQNQHRSSGQESDAKSTWFHRRSLYNRPARAA